MMPIQAMRLRAAVGGSGSSPLRFDPANKHVNVTLADSNTSALTEAGSGHYQAFCNGAKFSGKWVFEMTVALMNAANNIGFGVVNVTEGKGATAPTVGNGANYWSRETSALARAYNGISFTSLAVPGAVMTQGDVVTVTIDFATLELTARRNGTLVATWTASTIDLLGTRSYVPFADLWGSAGSPTKATINDTLIYPQAGFSQWLA